MCGIAGIFNIQSQTPELRNKALRMAQKIRHRGPDWSGIYVGGSASSVKNGVFTNAKGGTLLASMTLNDVVSTYGNAGMLQGPQGGGRHP